MVQNVAIVLYNDGNNTIVNQHVVFNSFAIGRDI